MPFLRLPPVRGLSIGMAFVRIGACGAAALLLACPAGLGASVQDDPRTQALVREIRAQFQRVDKEHERLRRLVQELGPPPEAESIRRFEPLIADYPVTEEPAAPAATEEAPTGPGPGRRVPLPFAVYEESTDPTPPFFSTGWMGNLGAVNIEEGWTNNPHSGRTCILAEYHDTAYWGGVAWLHPADNWGDDDGGYDLRGAARVSFWARGETGKEVVEFKVGVHQEPDKPFKDTAHAGSGKIRLTPWWKKYSIRLAQKDLSRVISGFVWVVEGQEDPVRFYIDDIIFE